MSGVRKSLWLLVHALFSAVAVCWFVVARRRCPLVFTHARDLDDTGEDQQMGPLVDELVKRGRIVEWTLVPLDGSFWTNLSAKRRLFVSHAVVVAPARVAATLLGMDKGRVRESLARLLLRALRPSVIYLVDESGSGQTLVRAARSLGIRTIGIQHGDFQPTNRQYAPGAGDLRVAPADVLAVWSPWFRERLLDVSPIYDGTNTRVTGRLRAPVRAREERGDGTTRVLFLGEAAGDAGRAVAPFVETVRDQDDLRVTVRLHPSRGGVSPGGLAEALLASDVVVGSASSALLEALFHDRPAIGVLGDPSGYVAGGLVEPCGRAEELPDLCRRLAGGGSATRSARERVWGAAPPDPVESVLALGDVHGGRPILIAGAPRSGTSLVAGVLKQCGAWLGRTVPGGPSNPKGFFENVALREGVDKQLLRELGCDPLGVRGLPTLESLPVVDGFRRRVLDSIESEGYRGDRPWAFKDAKLSLLWPVWRAAFPDARWVIVRRRPEDVVRSCLATHFMAGHSSDPGFWRDFVDEYTERLDALFAADVWSREVRSDEVVRGNGQSLRELAGELGLEWRAAAVRRFVTRRHWHANVGP